MVFQNYALYPHMTVYDNIALPLKIKNYGEEKIKQKIKTIAETLHIEDVLQKKPSQISGGQQQRVALARALVRDPAVFLLDEPLSNLDAKLRVEARAFLKSLQKEVGITTVFVTHDQSEAMALATTIAVLNKGVIKQVGDPYELYTKPTDIFTAGFIGSPAMNMIPGNPVKEGSSWKFVSDDFSLELSGMKFDNETETILGIRPEHIVIANDQGLNAKIKNVEPMGAVTYLEIRVGNTELTAQYTGLVKLEAGMDIKIRFVEDKMLFYDKKTEKLINY